MSLRRHSTSGWASGINAYAVVLLLGVFGATGLSDDVPESLQRPEILVTAGVLLLAGLVVLCFLVSRIRRILRRRAQRREERRLAERVAERVEQPPD
ncbi:DUF4126 domain-containing protein [Streptomyces lutosisoli]|uniref:DUF4126 domain-containing protein n=1 Tax=Streptomyces lutosisoli TaxID=2665721 RepID=A0ABW2VN76_9ACTN